MCSSDVGGIAKISVGFENIPSNEGPLCNSSSPRWFSFDVAPDLSLATFTIAHQLSNSDGGETPSNGFIELEFNQPVTASSEALKVPFEPILRPSVKGTWAVVANDSALPRVLRFQAVEPFKRSTHYTVNVEPDWKLVCDDSFSPQTGKSITEPHQFVPLFYFSTSTT